MKSSALSSNLSLLEVIREDFREQYRDRHIEDIKSRSFADLIIARTPSFVRKIVFQHGLQSDPLKLQAIALSRSAYRHQKVG